MKKLLILALILSATLVSCVSSGKYDAMTGERNAALSRGDSLGTILRYLRSDLITKQKEIEELNENLKKLKETYSALKNSSSASMLDMINKLEDMQKNLLSREQKLAEFRNKLEARDNAVRGLQKKLQDALLGFTQSGLTVSVRNGRVYVSLSNQLLFQTGKTDIDVKGQEALLELAKVLNEQKDINILVEGHTDKQQIVIQTKYKDNWDLSVLRATEVVRYLTVKGEVSPTRVIASGRGEFLPIDSLDTPDAWAKNRRTEIILTPNLEELYQILDK